MEKPPLKSPTNLGVKNDKDKKNSLVNTNYYNVEQLSTFTGFSKAYIYKLTHLSKIPFYKPNGGKILFSKAEIEQWIIHLKNQPNEK
jgi:excisionase family DNA binding protein